MIQLQKRLKEHFSEVISTKTSSHSIGLGFSIGTLIAILPTPGFGVLLGMLVVFLYKKINKFSLFAALAIWNPLTLIPIYILSKKIGNFLFANSATKSYDVEFFNQVFEFTRKFLVGNLILAVTISFASYFVVRYFVEKKKNRFKNL